MGIYKEKDHNKTDNVYRFPITGSYIEFFGADEVGKLRGPGRDILYLNEANLLNIESFRQLSWRTKETIFIDFNPADDYSWVYDVADDPRNILIHSTYKNNKGNLTIEQVADIESLQYADENLWKVYGLGLRGTSSETIYTHWKEVSQMPDDCDSYAFGLDFGFNHPAAFVKCGFKPGKVYMQELIYESKLTNDDLIYLIKSQFGVTRKTGKIYCETARPEAIEEMKRAGLNAVLADKSVIDGINSVKSQQLFITSDSVNLKKEIKAYKWKVDKDGKVLDEPVKFMDDGMDAGRYCIHTHLAKPKKLFADASY